MLFICMCSDILPREIKIIISIDCSSWLLMRETENIPFVRSKKPFVIMYISGGKLRLFVIITDKR